MRRKIKELMNKEEGFTLVELLAVIVILGIIVAIAIPAIGSVIDRAQGGADKAEISLIEDAGRLYFTTSENKAETEVLVSTLHKQGYLEDRDATASEGETPTSGLPKGGVKKVASKTTPITYTYEYDDSITEDK